jgi:FAD/FMN-containing dehydrogenase
MPMGIWVNDIHSKLNRTLVREIASPGSVADLQRTLVRARECNLKISCSGGRHAMGGQQFGTGNLHLDLTSLNRVLVFDREKGTIEVEAGILWPRLIDWLLIEQKDEKQPWSIRQKQTGADRLSIGGALSANIHGRGLKMRPFVDDIESFTLIKSTGEVLTCSRFENPQLFRLAVGGYGLFGIVYSVCLRLARRERLQRIVELGEIGDLADRFERRIREGFVFGDFQFAIDPHSSDFLRKGVFSCYRPAEAGARENSHRGLKPGDWKHLLYLAHCDPTEGFNQYARYYLSTDGQFYWSDTHQLSFYCDDYHREIDSSSDCSTPGSEMITELYVPRPALASFMEAAAVALRKNRTRVIYGTIRLIEHDDETFLAWARQNYACIVFNLHAQHTPSEIARSADAFRVLIDIALGFGGSFYLTYHHYATRGQFLAAYPQLPQFLARKRAHEPDSIIESTWYRGLRARFSSGAGSMHCHHRLDEGSTPEAHVRHENNRQPSGCFANSKGKWREWRGSNP